MFLPGGAGHSQIRLSQAPATLHPFRQGCGAGWGPGALASLNISSYFSASWQPSPFPALSCTPASSDKAPLLLLPSPPAAPSPTGEAKQEQGCAKAGQPPLSSPPPKGGPDPFVALLCLPWLWGKEQEPSLPHSMGSRQGRAHRALPWEGVSRQAAACPCPEQDNQGRHDSSRVKFHVFHLFEVLCHLLGTELQGTSVLHETSTGSTTTQHSLLHTRHRHAAARTGPDRAAQPATVLPTLLPPRRQPRPSCQAGFCPGLRCHSGAGAESGFQSTARNRGCSGARRHGTAAPQSRVTRTHRCLHTPSPSSGTWCSAGAGPRGSAQGASRRHRASQAPLGPWATPPMTKNRLGARQLEQEQRPVGMGGSSSHFFCERLNPSTESSGQDWFPAGDRTASALPTSQALPFPFTCL